MSLFPEWEQEHAKEIKELSGYPHKLILMWRKKYPACGLFEKRDGKITELFGA